jgi:hypothetical protein
VFPKVTFALKVVAVEVLAPLAVTVAKVSFVLEVNEAVPNNDPVIDPKTCSVPGITALPAFAAKTSRPENLYEYIGIFYILISPLVKRSSHQYMI